MSGPWAGWRARLRVYLQRDRVRAEHEEELRFHLEMQAEQHERSGLPPDAARRAARLAFGNPEALREASTDALVFARLEDWGRDLRLAGRRLRRAPVFCLVALSTLALGVGANTALFAALDAMLFRPLPWSQSEALVSLDEVRRATGESMAVSPANLRDWQVPAFEAVGAWAADHFDLAGAGEPETLAGQVVGPGYFEVLRARPARGRAFVAADFDPTGPAVVIVSDGLWRRRFGADPGLVGHQIRLGGQLHEVIGILAPDLRTPGDLRRARAFDVHLPARLPRDMMERRSEHLLDAFARLAPGATLDQARAQLDAASTRLAAQFPENREVRSVALPLRDALVGDARGVMLLLQVAAGAVLLIGCSNISGLMVVRGLARARELALRSALGARRGALVRESLAEALLLTAAGSALGAALAPALLGLLRGAAPAGTPLLGAATIDARALLAAAMLGAFCALATGLLPALRVLRHAPADVLRVDDRRAVPGRSWGARLVAAQAAIALALLSGGVLLVRSLAAVEAVPLGYDTARVLCVTIDLPASRYPDARRRLEFFATLQQRVAALPGVEGAGFANRFPLRGGWGTGVFVDGMPERSRPREADAQAVSPSYFETLGVPVLAGRGLLPTDDGLGEPVVVVNEAFVREHLAGRDPLGRRLRRHSEAPWTRIVGVVRDLRRDGPGLPAAPQVYYSAAQTALYPVRLSELAVRSAEGQSLVAAIQREVWALDPQQPLNRIATLAEALDRDLAPRRFSARGLAGLALVALFLALLGVYGTAAYAVSRRVPELGVRLALGAEPRRLARLVLSESGRQVLVGAGLGLPLALLLARTLEAQLVGLTPLDLPSLAVAAALLVAGGTLAALPTARRAARTDPATALRAD
ncbi:MAG: ADOP family duplicated permease [Vicinamibacteria bacterium]|nr:ADOP family duplicated permease [Vicinamibacteria bacterium]